MKYSLVIIGGGMAAARLLQQLDVHGYDQSVLVLSRESCFGYNRVLLPGFLAHECTLEELMTASVNSDKVQVLNDCEVHKIDPAQRKIHASRGLYEYDSLIFATGSDVPQADGLRALSADAKLTLRSLLDARELDALCVPGQQHTRTAIVIGGGLLGLEAAGALLKRGMQVHVIHRNRHILNRQLDSPGSEALQQQLEARGYQFHLGREVVSSQEDSADGKAPRRAITITLDDGAQLAGDVVLLATGTIPRIDLAANAGILCDRGITVDSALQTNLPGHYAIGECSEFEQQTCGLVEPTHLQADVLAQNLCGGQVRYQVPPTATRLKIDGIQLFSMGDLVPTDQQVTIDTSDQSIYRCLNFSEHTLIGAVLLGDTSGARAIQQKMGQAMNSPSDRERLAFGF